MMPVIYLRLAVFLLLAVFFGADFLTFLDADFLGAHFLKAVFFAVTSAGDPAEAIFLRRTSRKCFSCSTALHACMYADNLCLLW